jgi:hypothetical protein
MPWRQWRCSCGHDTVWTSQQKLRGPISRGDLGSKDSMMMWRERADAGDRRMRLLGGVQAGGGARTVGRKCSCAPDETHFRDAQCTYCGDCRTDRPAQKDKCQLAASSERQGARGCSSANPSTRMRAAAPVAGTRTRWRSCVHSPRGCGWGIARMLQ